MSKFYIENNTGTGKFNACETYNRRVDKMESNIAAIHQSKRKERFKEGTYERWYSEAHRIYMNNENDQKLYDKFDKDLCIIIPSHRYHRVWLKSCLNGISKLDCFSILAYDNPFFKAHKLDVMLPPSDTLMLADYLSFKPRTWHSGVTIPHVWNMLFAVQQAYIMGFEYIFSINGDFIMEKPNEFEKLRDMMGDADLFPLAWNPKKPSAGTAALIAKTEHMYDFWNDFVKTMYQNKGNAEARLGKYYREKKLKIKCFEEGPLSHQMPNPKSTWYNTIGLRHLHAEHKIRRWKKLEPVERKYFDETFINPFEKKTLLKYWQTKDKKFLSLWWKG